MTFFDATFNDPFDSEGIDDLSNAKRGDGDQIRDGRSTRDADIHDNNLMAAAQEIQSQERVRARRRSRWDQELWNIDISIESGLASIRGTTATIHAANGFTVQGQVEFCGVDVVEISASYGAVWVATNRVVAVHSTTNMHHDPNAIATTCLDDVLDALTEEDQPVRVLTTSQFAQVGTLRAGDYTVAISATELGQPRKQQHNAIVAKDQIVAVERRDRLDSVRFF